MAHICLIIWVILFFMGPPLIHMSIITNDSFGKPLLRINVVLDVIELVEVFQVYTFKIKQNLDGPNGPN